MARRYQPHQPFTVAMRLLVPTTTMVKGVKQKIYSDVDKSELFFASFRTFNGTEVFNNEVYTIEDTGTVDTWFNPHITTDCRVYIIETGDEWDIISSPENIDMRHQFMQFKVKRIGGKA